MRHGRPSLPPDGLNAEAVKRLGRAGLVTLWAIGPDRPASITLTPLGAARCVPPVKMVTAKRSRRWRPVNFKEPPERASKGRTVVASDVGEKDVLESNRRPVELRMERPGEPDDGGYTRPSYIVGLGQPLVNDQPVPCPGCHGRVAWGEYCG